MKLAAALQAHTKGTLGRKINSASGNASNVNKVLKGWQILHIVHGNFKTDEAYRHIHNFLDVIHLKMKDPKNVNQLRPSMDNWNHVLDGMTARPDTQALQILFYDRIHEILSLSQEIGIYDRAAEGSTEKTYEWFTGQVERLLKRRAQDANRASIKSQLGRDVLKPGGPAPKQRLESQSQGRKNSPSDRGRSKGRGKGKEGRRKSGGGRSGS